MPEIIVPVLKVSGQWEVDFDLQRCQQTEAALVSAMSSEIGSPAGSQRPNGGKNNPKSAY
jgi:hypothetical protein